MNLKKSDRVVDLRRQHPLWCKNQKCFMKKFELSHFVHFEPLPSAFITHWLCRFSQVIRSPRDQVHPSLSKWEQFTHTRVNRVNWLTSSKSIKIPCLYKKRRRGKINGVNDPFGFCLLHEETRTHTQGASWIFMSSRLQLFFLFNLLLCPLAHSDREVTCVKQTWRRL